jgi:hypothetical protein
MKIAPFLIGAISAQSGDDADRWDNTDFSLTDNIFTYEAPKDQRFDSTQCDKELVIQAVTCWESNHMGNLDHYVTVNDDNFGWKNIHHGHDQGNHSGQATTGLGQGTQESTNYGKRVPSTSPNYQIGTYSRGMMTDGYTANSKTAVNRIDYHSAMAFDNRYSGCIYEAADWDYNADSYNKIWRMSYGYDPSRTDNITTPTVTQYYNDASGIDKSNKVPIRPNWWHYFNSHILNVGQFDNAFDSYGLHLLVMANPAYEGLGYLNWITTFAKNAPENDDTDGPNAVTEDDDLGHWNVFPGSAIRNSGDGTGTAGTINDPAIATTEDNYTEGRFRGMVNYNTHDTVTDLYSGGYAFHLGRNCDTHLQASEITLVSGTIAAGTDLNMNPELDVHTRSSETATAGTIYTAGMNYDSYGTAGTIEAETSQWYSYLINPGSSIRDPSLNPQIDTDSSQTLYPWMSMAAVSSFPHNDLGQDFRFNIRILHHGGRGFPYYFLGNSASSVVLTDGGTTPQGVEAGTTVSTSTNFSITNSQINYLAQDSYYWYKVNTVQIMFPSYVRCPRFPRNIAIDRDNTVTASSPAETGFGAALVEEERRNGKLEDTFRCMDSANFNGHRGWDSSKPYNHETADVYSGSAYDGYDSSHNHRPTENYPYYLETLTENDGTPYGGIAVHRNEAEAVNAKTTGTIQFDNEPGFICGDVPPFNPQGGTLTLDDYKGEWYKCGQKYTVHGLMNMYDEHAQLEYGTQQEIWFQFWYHYVITWDIDSSVGNSAVTTPIDRASFWDKRNSNTARDDNVANATSHSDWPTGDTDESQVFHDGTHDNVYFTMSNYKNSFNSAGTTQQIYYDHIHNYPNILFNAFELRGIRFYCDQINSYNSNTCFHTNQPTPGSATDFEIIGDTMSNP